MPHHLFAGLRRPALTAGLLLLLAAPPGHAAPRPKLPPLAADRSAVTLRRPAAEQLNDLRGQRELQYADEPSPQLSAWDVFWMRIGRWLRDFLSTSGGRLTWRVLIYGGLLGAIAFVVLRLLNVDITGAFGRAPRRAPLAYETEAEDVNTPDLEQRLAEAEAAGHFRVAVRLGYLLVLRELAARHLIRWQPDKTNHDYVRELAAGPLQTGFAALTRQFDYAWYGELAPDAAHYAAARDARADFLAHLSRRAA